MSSDIINILRTRMLFSLSENGMNSSGIYGILILQLFDRISTSIPTALPFFYNQIKSHMDKAKFKPLAITNKEIKASITIDKYYNPKNNAMDKSVNKIVEAVINLITTIDYVKSLLFNGHELLPHFNEEIKIQPDIYFKLIALERDDEGRMEKISFEIFTYTHDIVYLKNFLYDCEKTYNISIQNKLGENLYFFDQHILKIKGGDNYTNVQHPPFITYNKHLFTTNRTFDNIFFKQKVDVENRLQFFLNNKAWYDAKGIPYTLGFLFYGIPGCGKTSTIKAIANETRRHIININLAEIRTKKQLKHLFFSNDIICKDNSLFTDIRNDNTEKFIIPIKSRLYVIEDIDASKSVISRYGKNPQLPTNVIYGKDNSGVNAPIYPMGVESNPRGGAPSGMRFQQIDADDEEIDLTTLLNILDGTLETPDRIIIVTTNFPGKLDNALIRPGRIDMFVEFERASREITREFYENFYGGKMDDTICAELPDYLWTPAEINQILFQCFNNPLKFLETIIHSRPAELFKYSHIRESDTNKDIVVKTIDAEKDTDKTNDANINTDANNETDRFMWEALGLRPKS